MVNNKKENNRKFINYSYYWLVCFLKSSQGNRMLSATKKKKH